jgi:hypothetical protein
MKKKGLIANILRILFFCFMLFLTIDFQFATIGSGESLHDWWDTNWHYRIQANVNSGDFARDDESIELKIDFSSLFSSWGIPGVFDPHSIRVVDQTQTISEVLSQFNPSTGEIVWLTGEMGAGTQKTYYVYFDHLENGPKELPHYYDSFEDGGILVLNFEDYVSVFYKIGGIEYETSRIGTENGEICFLKPPLGYSFLEGKTTRLGFLPPDEKSDQRIISITGGPVRYIINFQKAAVPRNGFFSSNNYGYEFYYVSNGYEVRTKFHIPGSWDLFPSGANDLGIFPDNIYQIYGLSGMLNIFPFDHEFIDDASDDGKNQRAFWIQGFEKEGWKAARNFYSRIESPPEIDVNFGQNIYVPDNHVQVELHAPLSREDFFTFYKKDDLKNRYRNTYPGEIIAKITWFDNDWKYRKSLSIDGSSVGPQFDYPIRIVVHYSEGEDSGEDVFLGGKCQFDFGDIRFTNSYGSALMPYWIEELTEGEEAIFWVNVDDIPESPGATTLLLYYGTSNAISMSDGMSTFDWFDDFSTDTSNAYDIGRHVNQWHGNGVDFPYYDPVNKRVAFDVSNNLAGGWKVRRGNLTIRDFAAKVIFGVTDFYPFNTTNGILGRWNGRDSFYGFHNSGGYYAHSPALVRGRRMEYIHTPPENTYHLLDGTPYTMELRIFGDRLKGIYNEGEIDEVVIEGTDTQHEEAGQVGIVVSQATGWFDVFFVRKYVDPEPSYGVWRREEEVPVHPPIDVKLDRKINRNLFSKEAFHTLSWAYNPENDGLPVISYRVYRKDDSSGQGEFQLIGIVPSDTFTFSDEYLDGSIKYEYVLTSVGPNGLDSLRSSPVGN